MDKELVGWLQPEGWGQWLYVQVDAGTQVVLSKDPSWDHISLTSPVGAVYKCATGVSCTTVEIANVKQHQSW